MPRLDIRHSEETISPIQQVGHKHDEERNTTYRVPGIIIISTHH